MFTSDINEREPNDCADVRSLIPKLYYPDFVYNIILKIGVIKAKTRHSIFSWNQQVQVSRRQCSLVLSSGTPNFTNKYVLP